MGGAVHRSTERRKPTMPAQPFRGGWTKKTDLWEREGLGSGAWTMTSTRVIRGFWNQIRQEGWRNHLCSVKCQEGERVGRRTGPLHGFLLGKHCWEGIS